MRITDDVLFCLESKVRRGETEFWNASVSSMESNMRVLLQNLSSFLCYEMQAVICDRILQYVMLIMEIVLWDNLLHFIIKRFVGSCWL